MQDTTALACHARHVTASVCLTFNFPEMLIIFQGADDRVWVLSWSLEGL